MQFKLLLKKPFSFMLWKEVLILLWINIKPLTALFQGLESLCSITQFEVSNKFCIVLRTFTYLNVSVDGIMSIRECCSLNCSNMLLIQTIWCVVHCETKSCIINLVLQVNYNICHCLEAWNTLIELAQREAFMSLEL